MLHSSDPRTGSLRAVRDGQGAPVTCASCGCRLESTADDTYRHFGRFAGRDARGCRVACVDEAHDRSGNPIVALTA
jgi:hypothetical protein